MEEFYEPVKHTPLVFEAGETKTVQVGFMWNPDNKMSNDWSLVAWGT